MRSATWLLGIVAIAAIARAEPATGTVVISCNEVDASLIVDGVLIPERTPAVLTLPLGPHVIEARKPPLVPEKKVIEVGDQQPVKVRFELLPATLPPPTGSDTGSGAGSGSGTGSGSAAPATGSGSGSAAPAAGSGAGSGSAASPPPLPASPPKPAMRCTEGGREVACIQGPHCTEGGRPVPCKKGDPLPQQQQPIAPAIGTGSGAPRPGPEPGAGSAAGSAAQPPPASGAAAIEIATTVPHAIAYVDGVPAREAPCRLELEPGEHVIAVYAAGMLPAETLVRATAGQRQRVELSPSKPRRRIDVPAQ